MWRYRYTDELYHKNGYKYIDKIRTSKGWRYIYDKVLGGNKKKAMQKAADNYAKEANNYMQVKYRGHPLGLYDYAVRRRDAQNKYEEAKKTYNRSIIGKAENVGKAISKAYKNSFKEVKRDIRKIANKGKKFTDKIIDKLGGKEYKKMEEAWKKVAAADRSRLRASEGRFDRRINLSSSINDHRDKYNRRTRNQILDEAEKQLRRREKEYWDTVYKFAGTPIGKVAKFFGKTGVSDKLRRQTATEWVKEKERLDKVASKADEETVQKYEQLLKKVADEQREKDIKNNIPKAVKNKTTDIGLASNDINAFKRRKIIEALPPITGGTSLYSPMPWDEMQAEINRQKKKKR